MNRNNIMTNFKTIIAQILLMTKRRFIILFFMRAKLIRICYLCSNLYLKNRSKMRSILILLILFLWIPLSASFPVESTEGLVSIIHNTSTFDWAGFFVGFLFFFLLPWSLLALPFFFLFPGGFKDSNFRRSFWIGFFVGLLIVLLIILVLLATLMETDFWQTY